MGPLSPSHVLIHDGARPFVSRRFIDDIISALGAHDAVIPVMPVADALWQQSGGHLVSSVERGDKCRAQTPQGFAYAPLLEAYRNFAGEAVDDAAVAIAAGMRPRTVAGSGRNLKITLADDMEIGEALISPARGFRTGFGYDVHRLIPGDGVILCGVKIPFDRSLKGHSDADVATHAITDAIYGALADGDIGRWFPPDDPQWKSADSMVFLLHASARAAEFGYAVTGVDCTIICEQPKITPHATAMRERIAACLKIPMELVGVKGDNLGGSGIHRARRRDRRTCRRYIDPRLETHDRSPVRNRPSPCCPRDGGFACRRAARARPALGGWCSPAAHLGRRGKRLPASGH